jgi:uncharacterized membrane protein YkvA (DUF1232 family)
MGKKASSSKMKMNVGDLRKMLQERGLSPEEFSKQVPISNMTIRRWLRKADKELIPPKYLPHLQIMNGARGYDSRIPANLDITNIESVSAYLMDISKEQDSLRDLQSDLTKKLGEKEFDMNFISLIKDLKKWATQKENISASLIAIGALIYFINPVDLVPDYLGPVGFIDDFGVMTLALTKIKSLMNK